MAGILNMSHRLQKLLSIAPDAASTKDGYGWQGQWLFDEGADDAYYALVV